MADKPPGAPKSQVGLEEYLKTREKRAKNKMKLRFPMWVVFLTAIPAAYLVFLIIYFLVRLRFLAEH